MRIVASFEVLRELTAIVLPLSSATDLIVSLAQNSLWFQPGTSVDRTWTMERRSSLASMTALATVCGPIPARSISPAASAVSAGPAPAMKKGSIT